MTQEKIGLSLLARALALACFFVTLSSSRAEEASSETFLEKYCVSCHNPEKRKGDLDLEPMLSSQPDGASAETWEKILHALRDREMPPKGKTQPPEEQRQRFSDRLQVALDRVRENSPRNPGRVTLRRLNRVEYENTIRDLLGVEFKASDEFPRDEVGYGFDNIADVLSLSPVLMEKYLNAAEKITAKAIVSSPPAWPPVQRIPQKSMQLRNSSDNEALRPLNDRYLGFYREASALAPFELSSPGEYEIAIRAYQEAAGPEPAAFEIHLDDEVLTRVDVKALSNAPEILRIPAKIEKGGHRVRLTYVNNYNELQSPDPKLRGDRNVFLEYVEIIGPKDKPRPALPESHTRLIPRHPEPGQEEASAREILGKFALRAYRRPPLSAEIDQLIALVMGEKAQGVSFEESIALGLQAILVSPKFLFRWELDPTNSQSPVRELGDFEIASRLSYFLWSTMPDEELFRLAGEGKLAEEANLRGQAKRMLVDSRSKALVENFAGQWLQIRNMDSVQPDPQTFPQFNGDLRAAMKKETELFFETIMREDRSVLQLLDADFTFLNEILAKHYGIDGVKGGEFRRVALDSRSRRGGVLTQASILTLTSNPTRTAPVIRGKWVLEQILGTPPPPPPANVQPLAEGKKASETASLRERMELHRSKPDCAGCHAKMDPIGFALENYDAIGRWRDLDGTFPIDPAGELAGGVKVTGPDSLKKILQAREEFLRSLAEKMLTYALGRGTEFYDKATVTELVNQLRARDQKFSALVEGIVLSQPFRQRTIEAPEP